MSKATEQARLKLLLPGSVVKFESGTITSRLDGHNNPYFFVVDYNTETSIASGCSLPPEANKLIQPDPDFSSLEDRDTKACVVPLSTTPYKIVQIQKNIERWPAGALVQLKTLLVSTGAASHRLSRIGRETRDLPAKARNFKLAEEVRRLRFYKHMGA